MRQIGAGRPVAVPDPPAPIAFAGRVAGGGTAVRGPLGGFILTTTTGSTDAAMVLSTTALYAYAYTGSAVAVSGAYAKLFGVWADAAENPLPGIGLPAAPKIWAEVSQTGDAINLLYKRNLNPSGPGDDDTLQRTITGFGYGQTVHFRVVRDLAGYTVTLTVADMDYVDVIPETRIADPWRYAADLVGGGDSYTTQDTMQTRLLRLDVTPLSLGAYQGTDPATQHAYRSLSRSVRQPTAALSRPWLSVGTNAYGGVWIWDNWFLGLTASRMGPAMRDLARNNLLNLLDWQGADGRVPRAVHADGSEEGASNESQPWVAQTAVLLSRGDTDAWVDYVKVKRAVQWWDTRRTAAGLYQWLNRPECGFDNAISLGYPEDSGGDEYNAYTLRYESVSATALMAREWDALALMADRHEPAAAADYRARAQAARDAINAALWDDATGYYYNRDVQSGALNKVLHMETGLFAVWAGVASPARARRVLDRITLWASRHGIYTVAPEQAGFHDNQNSEIGVNWNGPHWTPFGYLLVQALIAQGRTDDALAIAGNAAAASALLRRRQANSFHLPEAWSAADATRTVGATDFNGFGCVGTFSLPELAAGQDTAALTLAALEVPRRVGVVPDGATAPQAASLPGLAIRTFARVVIEGYRKVDGAVIGETLTNTYGVPIHVRHIVAPYPTSDTVARGLVQVQLAGTTTWMDWEQFTAPAGGVRGIEQWWSFVVPIGASWRLNDANNDKIAFGNVVIDGLLG